MKIIRTDTLCRNPWVEFRQKVYVDKTGRERQWAFVERVKCQQAVFMIPVDPARKQILLIRQFRLPLERYVIEFPAGLIDPDEDPCKTAERELLEETGFSGRLESLGPALALSAGITNETAFAAHMSVDLDPKKQATQACEAAEDIEVLIVNLEDLKSRLIDLEQTGDVIDAKLYCFSYAERNHDG